MMQSFNPYRIYRWKEFVAALLAFGCFLVPGSAYGASGTIYSLGSINQTASEQSSGAGVNTSGQVSGYSTLTGTNFKTHAFRYDGTPGAGGIMRDLGTLGGSESSGAGINESGQVSGDSLTSGDHTVHAMRYDGTPGSGGIMRDLGTLGGDLSHGFAVNASGQVVGYSDLPVPLGASPISHAFRYDGTPGAGGVMQDLGTLGSTYSEAFGINDAGQVVGESSTAAGGGSRAFLYTGTPGDGGAMFNLGSISGTAGGSTARAINNFGQVTGNSSTLISDHHAFRYDGVPGAGGVMRDLGTLGGNDSYGYGINDTGQVVGSSMYITGQYKYHAFIASITPAGTSVMIDLNTYLAAKNPTEATKWVLQTAGDITNNGLITGFGTYIDQFGISSQRAFLLDASDLVPEPTTGFSAICVAGAFLTRRRRSRGAASTT